MRTFACRFESRPAGKGRTTTTTHLLKLGQRYVPLGVLWPGFAINTIVYGLALMVVWAAARDVRSAVRRRRAGESAPPPPTPPTAPTAP